MGLDVHQDYTFGFENLYEDGNHFLERGARGVHSPFYSGQFFDFK